MHTWCDCSRVGVVGRMRVRVRVCKNIICRIGTRIIVSPVRPVFLHPDKSLSSFMGSGMVPLNVLLRVRAFARVSANAAGPHSCKDRVVELQVLAKVSCYLIGTPTLHGHYHWTSIAKRTGEDLRVRILQPHH